MSGILFHWEKMGKYFKLSKNSPNFYFNLGKTMSDAVL